MKVLVRRFVLLWCCFFVAVLAVYAARPPRETLLLNPGWKYLQGDCSGAERPGFDDTGWEDVGLPHSFSIPYFMSKDFYIGYGWYRKQVELKAADLKKRLFLEFDGVFQEAEIFVNGKRVGSHIGGYTGFSVDITAAARRGRNQIAVRVNNLWRPDVAPRAGEHVFSGGIYRNVRLVKKESVYIGWYGTLITTPGLEASNGKSSVVRVETDVCNDSGTEGSFRLQTCILDNQGKQVAVVESDGTIAAGTRHKYIQQTPPVSQPSLWSPQSPYLYKAVSSLYRDGKLLDCTETVFGFRWFRWTADKGFFLNGEHFLIRGANVHQDQAGWGDAVTESAMQRDVEMMKEAGFNFIRGSHYPHAPAFSQACDEAGMLFWSEAPFWGIGGFKQDGYWNSSAYPADSLQCAAFEASALQQLEEMIRIHRNHPSIVAWSVCNEAFFSAREAMPGVRRLLGRMVDLVHRLDPMRPAAVGGAQRPLGDERIDHIGDVAGYNGDGATQPDFQSPGVPSLVSEYGSVTADRPGEYGPGWGDLSRDDGWKGCPWRSGQAIWCGFDHGSIAGSALGKMGIVDYFRIPKRSWHWYRNEYAGIAPPEWPADAPPARLRLEADRTRGIRTDGTDDVFLTVSVQDASGRTVSAAPTVELRVVSGPGEFPTGRSIRFEADSDIRIRDGQAAIAFRSYYSGTTVIEAISAGLVKARVELKFEGGERYREGRTPVVKSRPYVRFKRSRTDAEVRTFGPNNPVFAGSYADGPPSGMAADGNPATCWRAAGTDHAPYWMLDTEKNLLLKQLHILLPPQAGDRFVVEVSDNRIVWKTVHDRPLEERRELFLTFGDDAPSVRFVRIRFGRGTEAALSEVEVKGVVCE